MDKLIRDNWCSVVRSVVYMRDWLGFDEQSLLAWMEDNAILTDSELRSIQAEIHDPALLLYLFKTEH